MSRAAGTIGAIKKRLQMFKRSGSRDVTEFAIEIAREFSTRCPPELSARSAIAVARAIDEICNRAVEYQRAARLGIYGKAKLGTEFKLQLKESGYASEFVDELTTRLLMSLSAK
jgi:hypothetical protein